MENYAIRSLFPIMLALTVVHISAQDAPTCRSINLSTDAYDSVTLTLADLVPNASQVVPVTMIARNPAGGVIAQTLAANPDDFLRFAGCRYIGRDIYVDVMNGTDMCRSTVEIKPFEGATIFGRSTTVFCIDSLALGGEIDNQAPLAKTACEELAPANLVADWVKPYPCVTDQDTAKIIYREYEAFDKFGRRSVGYDTITIMRLPPLTNENTYCAEKDTAYCQDDPRAFGPFVILPRFDGPNCDTIRLINPDGSPKKFNAKCGLNIHVNRMPFPSDCQDLEMYQVEIKQSCFGSAISGCVSQNTISNTIGQLGNSPGYLECTFWRVVLDTVAPIVECPEDTIILRTGAQDCASQMLLPDIAATDSCGSVKQVKAMIEGFGTFAYYPSSQGFKSDRIVTIPHSSEALLVVFEAFDECHNVGRDSCYVMVKDVTAPVAASVKGLNVSVGSKVAWLEVDQIDEESWDNCDIALRLVRRTDWQTAGINLCDSLQPFYSGVGDDTIWSPVFNDQDPSSIETHYDMAVKWLTYDEAACGKLIGEAWKYDLARYASLECHQSIDPFDFDVKMEELLDTTLPFDQVKQIGGGWSHSVPLVCADVCSSVKVELLLMDYWCNWGRSWSMIWVEDKTPVEIVKPPEEVVELSCKSFKAHRTDFGPDFESIYDLAHAAEGGNSAAINHLDELYGTFVPAWRHPSGDLVDSSGATLECEIAVQDSVCVCRDSLVEVPVYDSDQGWIVEEQIRRFCSFVPRIDTISNGAVLVNCIENVQQVEQIKLSLDECGEGWIERTWKIWKKCQPHDSLIGTKIPDTVKFTQKILVADTCQIDPGMFLLPQDTGIVTCVLEFDPDGSGNVGGSAHPDSTGFPEYLLDDDCRLVGIGYIDKVLEEVNSDTFCYKILRTWCFADWCDVDQVPANWQTDPEYDGIVFKHLQKIIVTCECRCELDCSALRDTSIVCADIPADVTELFSLFNTPDIIHPDTAMICDFTLDSLIQIDTSDCGFGTISQTWFLLDGMSAKIDSCTEVITLTPDSITITRQTSYGGDAEPFNCSDSLILDPVEVVDVCPKFGAFSISNDSPYAVNDSNDASGNYPVGIHFVNYVITNACLDTIRLTDTITVIDDVNPLVIAFSDPCVSFSEWETDFDNDPLNPSIRMMLGLTGADNCEVDTVFLVNLDSMFFPDQVTRDSVLYTYQWQARDTSNNLSDVKEVFILVSDSCQISLQAPEIQITESEKTSTYERSNPDLEVSGRLDIAKHNLISASEGAMFKLYQNSPNPFHDKTSISFSLSQAAEVTLRVFDSRGQQVSSLTQSYVRGLHEVPLDREVLMVDGFYFYQMEVNGIVETRKMMLVR